MTSYLNQMGVVELHEYLRLRMELLPGLGRARAVHVAAVGPVAAGARGVAVGLQGLHGNLERAAERA